MTISFTHRFSIFDAVWVLATVIVMFYHLVRISNQFRRIQSWCFRMLLDNFILGIVLPWPQSIGATFSAVICFLRNGGLWEFGPYFYSRVTVGVCKLSLSVKYWRLADRAKRILVDTWIGIILVNHIWITFLDTFKLVGWPLKPRLLFMIFVCTWSRYI